MSLSGKPVLFLMSLLKHPGELVSKDTITKRLCGDVAVTDNSLVQVAATVRTARGRDSDIRAFEATR